MTSTTTETGAGLRCKHCGASVGWWGGLNGTQRSYWKHQVSKPLPFHHAPEAVGQADYERFYKRAVERYLKKLQRP